MRGLGGKGLDGQYVPTPRATAALPLGFLVGLSVAAVIAVPLDLATRGWVIVIGGWLGIAVAARRVAYRPRRRRLIDPRIRRVEYFQFGLSLPILVLSWLYAWAVVSGYADGDAWARAWVDWTAPAIDWLGHVIPAVPYYEQELIARGRAERIPIVTHAMAVGMLFQFGVYTVFTLSPTQWWSTYDGPESPRVKKFRLCFGPLYLLMCAGFIHMTLTGIPISEEYNYRGMGNRLHYDDVSLIVQVSVALIAFSGMAWFCSLGWVEWWRLRRRPVATHDKDRRRQQDGSSRTRRASG